MFVGDDCQIDFDACTTSPCSLGRKCNDTDADTHKATPSLPAFTCEACPTGYQDDGGKCEGM